MVYGADVGAPSRDKSTQHGSALGHGVDLSIGTLKAGHQKHSALQARRIAYRRDGRIDARTWLGKRWKGGGHHHGGCVLNLNRCGRNRQPHPFQKVR